MNVHAFRCSTDPTLYGFTQNATGANLPADKCSGAWDYFKEMRNVTPGQHLAGVDARTLLRDLGQHGYHLNRSVVTVTVAR